MRINTFSSMFVYSLFCSSQWMPNSAFEKNLIMLNIQFRNFRLLTFSYISLKCLNYAVNICKMFYWNYFSIGKATGNIQYTWERTLKCSKLTNIVIVKLNIHQIMLSEKGRISGKERKLTIWKLKNVDLAWIFEILSLR